MKPDDTITVGEALARVRAEGYRAGIEDAAKECTERGILNDAVEGGSTVLDRNGWIDTAAGHRALECRECAAAIRSLAPRERA